mgnify:CR=1 FL=1
MQEWKIRQYIYHKLHTNFSDNLNNVPVVYNEATIVEDAVKHFHEKVDEWLYPAKSYFVAICYAYWIAQDYKEEFFDLLNDPELLYGNDPYFKTYREDPETYDAILNEIELPPSDGMVPDVRKYYEAECGIEQPVPNTGNSKSD